MVLLERLLLQKNVFSYFEKSYFRACCKLQLELSRETNVFLGDVTTSVMSRCLINYILGGKEEEKHSLYLGNLEKKKIIFASNCL